MNIKLDNKKLNLAEQFARFAAYYKEQAKSGAYDQPMGVRQEESKLTKNLELEQLKHEEYE